MTENAADAPIRIPHNCQTPQCPNDFRIINYDVLTGETTFLCYPCQLGFWMSVLQQLTEQGAITGEAAPADTKPVSLCICIGEPGSNITCPTHGQAADVDGQALAQNAPQD